jgi:ABC-type multidrug transport system fused ATPase/permease subunit
MYTLASCRSQRYYIPSARELQRIESITRSPIYSKFSEALAGVATIRAYRREDYFTAASDELMELNAYAFVTQRAAASWLAMRLDFMGLVILTCAGGHFDTIQFVLSSESSESSEGLLLRNFLQSHGCNLLPAL